MVWPAIGLGIAQAGLGFASSYSASGRQHRQAKERIKIQNQQAVASRNFQNEQIRSQNAYTAMAFGIKKQLVETQKNLNIDAANRAYTGAFINRDRQLTALAFSRNQRQQELLEAVGAANASMESDNRSAALAYAKNTWGRYGQQSVEDKLQVRDINAATKLTIADTQGQLEARNAQLDAQVAIPPYMQKQLPPAMQMALPGGPSALDIGLMGASSLMSGLSTYNQFAPDQFKVNKMFTKDWGV
tara:strand:- start:3328 stop:4059 length:732 start_codon:yes stop_codon:yes gene_type:complete